MFSHARSTWVDERTTCGVSAYESYMRGLVVVASKKILATLPVLFNQTGVSKHL